MLSKLSLSLLLTLSYVEKVVSCGFTIHMSVTHRAINNYFSGPPSSFETLFVENRGALEGGSPYPDYGYQCGPNHDDGEYTHWAPYQWQAANWIRANYAQPWNSSGQTIVSFLAGAVSHYIADISWHGLAETPQDYGLIETIGFLDWNCTGLCQPAHTQADTGRSYYFFTFFFIFLTSLPFFLYFLPITISNLSYLLLSFLTYHYI
jgi:hypothetical protein